MKYRIICYERIDCDLEDDVLFNSPEEAEADLKQCEFLQPENIYRLEEVDDELEEKEY